MSRSAVRLGAACLAVGATALATAGPAAALTPAPGPGILAIEAGTGTDGTPTPNGPATNSDLATVVGVALDAAGNVYVSDAGNSEVYEISPAGTLTIIAGTGGFGKSIPGPATSSPFDNNRGIAVDANGNIYIADEDNQEIDKITPAGTLSIIAGTGTAGAATPGPATSSQLNYPDGVAVDAAGNVYIADLGNNEIEKVSPAGTLTIVAGTGTAGTPTPGPATSSELNVPYGVAVDTAGNIYIADGGNNEIEKVSPAGTLTIVAGTGTAGTPTPGPATSSELNVPYGVAVDTAGNIDIADTGNSEIEKVDPTGTLTIIAGTGTRGASTPGPATSSELKDPEAAAADAAGNIYIADTDNHEVEEVGALTPASTGAPASLPDAPYAALLALTALPVGGYVLLRRRTSHGDAD